MFDLKGDVAVISGASSGLGRQMARSFADRGANLVILARRVERLEEFNDAVGKMKKRRCENCIKMQMEMILKP